MRAGVVVELTGSFYRIEGEGYSGDDRTVDYVLYANGVTEIDGTPSSAFDARTIVQTAYDLLCAKGWKVEVE